MSIVKQIEDSSKVKKRIKELIKKKFSSTLKLYILDSGSCNGCELELQVLFSPLYDLSSCGIKIIYDFSKADVLLITGLMTRSMYKEMTPHLNRLKNSKEVILIGDCPIDRGVFQDSVALEAKGSTLFPQAFQITGCPPEPLRLMRGLMEFLEKY